MQWPDSLDTDLDILGEDIKKLLQDIDLELEENGYQAEDET